MHAFNTAKLTQEKTVQNVCNCESVLRTWFTCQPVEMKNSNKSANLHLRFSARIPPSARFIPESETLSALRRIEPDVVRVPFEVGANSPTAQERPFMLLV